MKRKSLSIIILLIFIIIGIIYLKDRLPELKNVLKVNLNYVTLILFFSVLGDMSDGLKFKILMNFYSINLKFKEWFGLTYIVGFGNYISPFRAGTSIKAVYLKKKYKFPYTFFASITGLSYIMTFLSYGLFGLFLNFTYPIVRTEYKGVFILFFTIICLLGIVSLFLLPLIPRTNINILKYATQGIHELKRIRTNKLLILKLFLLDLSRSFFYAFRIYFGFKAYNTLFPFSVSLLTSLLASFSLILSITPMGLGIRESIIVIVAKLNGINGLTGLYVGALTRAISAGAILIGGPIFSFLLIKKLWLKSASSSDIKKEDFKKQIP